MSEFEVEGRVFDYGVGIVLLGEAIVGHHCQSAADGKREDESQTC